MDFNAIIKTLTLVGMETPAFAALFQQVLGAFNEKDQGNLKDTYERALQNATTQHQEAQDL